MASCDAMRPIVSSWLNFIASRMLCIYTVGHQRSWLNFISAAINVRGRVSSCSHLHSFPLTSTMTSTYEASINVGGRRGQLVQLGPHHLELRKRELGDQQRVPGGRSTILKLSRPAHKHKHKHVTELITSRRAGTEVFVGSAGRGGGSTGLGYVTRHNRPCVTLNGRVL